MKKLSFLFAAVIMAVVVSAQATDFTGKWKLNNTRSTLNDQFSMAPYEVNVNQNGNDLSVEKHFSFQGNNISVKNNFTLDGQECINEGWQGSRKKSNAGWDDAKQELTIKSKLTMQDGNEVSITEVYKKSEDNMVLVSSATSSYGDLNETMVFDRQ